MKINIEQINIIFDSLIEDIYNADDAYEEEYNEVYLPVSDVMSTKDVIELISESTSREVVIDYFVSKLTLEEIIKKIAYELTIETRQFHNFEFSEERSNNFYDIKEILDAVNIDEICASLIKILDFNGLILIFEKSIERRKRQ